MNLSTSSLCLLMTVVSLGHHISGRPTDFVKVDGQRFTLGGAPYTVFGANAHWIGLMGLTTEEMDVAFQNIAATGGTTVRTWGFNEVITASGDYYQLWNEGTPTVNHGATGLENFDNVISTAKANGMRLIVTLTNNWEDYGGMDVYVNQILGQGQPHDYFYTHHQVINAYKNYVKAWIERYIDEPTIIAWELANEPRCTGSTDVTSGTCTTATITNWAKIMSSYIKSLDRNHLVGLGDEGWFKWSNSTDECYDGSHGIDFDANLAIESIDFGTFHLYPDIWNASTHSAMDWGQAWIKNHRFLQAGRNKPVLMEEFGILAAVDQVGTYKNWYTAIVDGGLAGVLTWQAGSNLTRGTTPPDDGYVIYPGTTIYEMESTYAARLKARDRRVS